MAGENAKVILYLCEARFTGETEVRYGAPPEIGSLHRCVVFVRDSETHRVAEILKGLGWESITLTPQPLERGTLGDPSMASFRPHYEACLRDGHSLVWYS